MGIDLGRGNGTMPQQRLDISNIHTSFQQRRRKGMPKLVGMENEAILVEVENGTWYNPLKGYGLRHSPFRIREMLSWHEKAGSILNWLFQSAKTL